MKTSLRKILFILIPLSLLFLSFTCSGEDDDDIDNCDACIQAQVELCELYHANNCKENTDEAKKVRQKVIDKCLDGAEKAKYIHLRCYRANSTGECEEGAFHCE